ncbi:MAG: helix-turn-helix transcriptional regulator [Defluviitaleaceae bacterium]|nr:helix-turn-helix transcriptional regulator [Defluviitaleaceae bacterium]
MNTKKPPIGLILKRIRKDVGLSQEAVSNVLMYDRTKISHIENGTCSCPDDTLRDFKKVLGVERLPFTETERREFTKLLHKWHDMINEREFEDALEMQKELKCIKYLEYDTELNKLYLLFECRLLLGYMKDPDKAMTILKKIEAYGELSIVEEHHYNYNMGTLSIIRGNKEDMFKYYLRAFELMQNGLKVNFVLYYNIAYCYELMGRHARSIAFLEKIRELNYGGGKVLSKIVVDAFLALNFIKIGYLQGAKTLLDECAKQIPDDDPKYKHLILNNYGYMYRVAKNFYTAIKYLDMALDCSEKGSIDYLGNLYQKAWCLLELRNFNACKELVQEGMGLTTESTIYSILFKSLHHLITLNETNSFEYVYGVTIPYLVEQKNNDVALEYCNFVINYYTKRNTVPTSKIGKLKKIAYHLYAEMKEGGLEEW